MNLQRSSVSVIIPHYNQCALIERCLASVARQLSKDDEIIIVDDHSSPPLTVDTHIWTPIVRVIRLSENCGPGMARNIGVEQANHHYIAFLDADDVALIGRVDAQLAALEKNPDWVGCVGDYIYQRHEQINTRNNNSKEESFDIRKELLEGRIFAAGSTLMVNREFFLEIGGYNPTLRVYEDWDLLLRMVLRSKVGHSGSPLAIISPSTRRATGDERLRVLTQLGDAYGGRLNSKEYNNFQYALAYERASTYFRERKFWRGLLALLIGFRLAPLTLSRRLTARLLHGVP